MEESARGIARSVRAGEINILQVPRLECIYVDDAFDVQELNSPHDLGTTGLGPTGSPANPF